MKLLIVIILFAASSFGYVDMSDQAARADDLNLDLDVYVQDMALAGITLGFIFNLFLWKVR